MSASLAIGIYTNNC